MVNKVILIGNLGGEPDFRQLESGARVARFSLATNENYKDKTGQWVKNTEWHNIVAWGYTADYVKNNLTKGSMVFVEGKISTRKWQDKEGQTRYTTEIETNTIRSLEKRSEEGGNTGYNDTGSMSSGDSRYITGNDTEDDLPF